jgi:hypothetical protein
MIHTLCTVHRCLLLLPAYTLLTQEVPDLHSPVGQGHVDGEMRVTEAHLVQEALSDTSDQVLNVGAHSTDAGQLQMYIQNGLAEGTLFVSKLT